tara:strand:- start:282 stop:749 length:468 start_codon:yes stop_codon:yes gene_type:complete
MFFRFKNHYVLIYFLVFIFLTNCQLKEPLNNHGIVFLKNRSEKLTVNSSNKNDAIRIIGQPHSKSVKNENDWIYFERILTKGDYHKLGQKVLKANNVLVLSFDKYGILKNKTFLNKEDKNKISFTGKNTENELSQKSFTERFLQGMKEKMYGRKK